MFFRRPISWQQVGAGLFNQSHRIFVCGSNQPFKALAFLLGNSEQSSRNLSRVPEICSAASGLLCVKSTLLPINNVMVHSLGNVAINLGLIRGNRNVSTPHAVNFRGFINSASPNEIETGRNSRSMDFVRGILNENETKGFMRDSQHSRYGVDQNADIVHIKLIRNNTFVTLTDSKGNKKIGASLGCLSELKGGPKASRYAAEATAEHVGRLAKNMGLKSVVVKVNGFCYFKKKRQTILGFREGYSNSRGDQNPIVYIEDTTRLPHNGCRLPKRRRVKKRSK